jgi:hypothetical protein
MTVHLPLEARALATKSPGMCAYQNVMESVVNLWKTFWKIKQ